MVAKHQKRNHGMLKEERDKEARITNLALRLRVLIDKVNGVKGTGEVKVIRTKGDENSCSYRTRS